MTAYKQPFLFLCVFFSLVSQAQNSNYQNHSYRPYDKYVYNSEHRFHTSIKPYNVRDISKIVSIDTLFVTNPKNAILNYATNQNYVQYHSPDFNFTINPAGNFETSRQFGDTVQGWINSRGFTIDADVRNKIFVHTSFYEIQSNFKDYRYDRIKELGRNTIPGQSRGKRFKEDGLDYAFANAYISYVPSDIFDFQFGHGKHFLGDGYRSILLSDNAHNYPYFKITTDVWNIKYINMWSQHMYIDNPHLPNTRFPIKWNVMHYLDWSVTDWLNVGLFETIIWSNEDTLGNYRGFDFNYLNPVIFLRPVEFQLGSPDNVIMGVSGKITLFKNHVFYGQIAIDEFKLAEIKARNGWWGNKYAIQMGYKTFDLGVKNLDVQSEINLVRPFMYSHFLESQNYGHALQPLAHPRGSNFYESVSFVRYNINRWFFEAKFQYLVYGQDSAGTNYGNDIFKLYQIRTLEYGNSLAEHAIQNTVIYKDFSVSYLINPKNAMNITAGVTHRTQNSDILNKNQFMYYVAFRTTLHNYYYDF
ncbi:MAG: hypothetical protein M0R02_02190 [Bacteroidales bacterium]|nr:hypothetical protein [Bacteroidales bacterium]HPY82365.1 hypothetical protein [Bacteroidales bacterium]